ncbi:MAG: hypothetical protein NZ742_00635 [Acidobacteria bacterium]|nr:hypothetical protein [Acidobacteriota bacterium]MDW7983321.1 hypothetical protein [Acidobacteriota bacterium]
MKGLVLRGVVFLYGLYGWRDLAVAQTWTQTYGGGQVEVAYSAQTTIEGGLVITGYTESFGTGGTDAWVLRLDAAGDLVWQKAFGGGDSDVAYAVRVTSDGGFVLCGYTSSSTAGGDVRAWVFRLNADGGLVWQRAYGPGVAYDVRPTPDGGFVVVGTTTAFGATGLDLWVLRLDAQGNIVGQKRYGGGGSDVGYSVRVTPDGGFVVAGFTTSFGAGSYDAWVLRLDASGGVLWQRAYGGGLQDWAYSVDLTPDGGFVVAGYTESFGAGRNDVWVLKLDASGSVQWTATYGDTADDYAYAVQTLPAGGFIVAGYTTSFGAVYLGDFWGLRLGSDGAIVWQKRYGGVSYDWAYAVQVTPDGGFVFAGMSQSFNALNRDVWVVRTDGTGGVAGPCPLIHDTSAVLRRDPIRFTNTGAEAVDTSAVAVMTEARTVNTGGVPARQCPLSPDFSVECQPARIVVSWGRPATSLCTARSLNGFQADVTLGCRDLPAGMACEFAPNPVTLLAVETGTSRLTVRIRSSIEEGSYTLWVQGRSGSLARETALQVEVWSRHSIGPPPRRGRAPYP